MNEEEWKDYMISFVEIANSMNSIEALIENKDEPRYKEAKYRWDRAELALRQMDDAFQTIQTNHEQK